MSFGLVWATECQNSLDYRIRTPHKKKRKKKKLAGREGGQREGEGNILTLSQ